MIAAAVPSIRKAFETLEAGYGGRDYLVGDTPTLPDFLLAPPLAYVGLFPEGKELLSKFPNVRRAHEAFANRPSFVMTGQG